jgi:hypothetical protein
MAGEVLHAPRERLAPATIAMHHALSTLMEELEAIDWYQQRADDTQDPHLRAILLHNMEEEMEHAAMTLEWLRRTSGLFAEKLETYLFSEGDITRAGCPDGADAGDDAPAPEIVPPLPEGGGAAARDGADRRPTVGHLKSEDGA